MTGDKVLVLLLWNYDGVANDTNRWVCEEVSGFCENNETKSPSRKFSKLALAKIWHFVNLKKYPSSLSSLAYIDLLPELWIKDIDI